MSILIKGMEMPQTCSDCPMCYDYYYCNLAKRSFGEGDCVEIRMDWCPLIEIPPHGDLIDGDALIEEWDNGLMDDAPTIIEAEGEE